MGPSPRVDDKPPRFGELALLAPGAIDDRAARGESHSRFAANTGTGTGDKDHPVLEIGQCSYFSKIPS